MPVPSSMPLMSQSSREISPIIKVHIPIEKLYSDILEKIFIYLPGVSCITASCVSRNFYAAFNDPDFITRYLQLHNGCAREADLSGRRAVELAIRAGDRITKLDLSHCHLDTILVRRLVCECRNLETLNLEDLNGELSTHDILYILKHLTSLRSFSVGDINLKSLTSAFSERHCKYGDSVRVFKTKDIELDFSFENLSIREFMQLEGLDMGASEGHLLVALNLSPNVSSSFRSTTGDRRLHMFLYQLYHSEHVLTSWHCANFRHVSFEQGMTQQDVMDIAIAEYPIAIDSVNLAFGDEEIENTKLITIATQPKFNNITQLSIAKPILDCVHIISGHPQFNTLQSLTLSGYELTEIAWRQLLPDPHNHEAFKQLKYLQLKVNDVALQLLVELHNPSVLPSLLTLKLESANFFLIRNNILHMRPDVLLWDAEVLGLSLSRPRLKIYDHPRNLKGEYGGYYKDGKYYVSSKRNFDETEKMRVRRPAIVAMVMALMAPLLVLKEQTNQYALNNISMPREHCGVEIIACCLTITFLAVAILSEWKNIAKQKAKQRQNIVFLGN